MKYLVIATKWNSDAQKSEHYVVGIFSDLVMATLFANAYEIKYSFKPEIKTVESIKF